MRTAGQWELSRQSLVDVLGEKHYTPGEFVDVLGAPSFTALLKSIKPIAVPCFKALLKAKVRHHRRGLNKRFSKGCWEIKSYTFTYRSQAVDGREIILSGRVTFPGNKDTIRRFLLTMSLNTTACAASRISFWSAAISGLPRSRWRRSAKKSELR